MIEVGIKIFLKKQVLDVQGRSLAQTLFHQGYAIKDCNYGKFIKLQINTDNKEEALEQSQKMAKNVLCNTLVETFELEILSS